METWLIFAVISAFAAGTHNFLIKVMAEKKYDISYVNIISYFIITLSFGIYFLLNYKNIDISNIGIISTLAFLITGLFYLSIFSRVESMKNIDTVIFFPIYKTIGPILVTLISLFLFGEKLNFIEILGILFGISIPLMLINSKEKQKQKDIFKGIIFLLITAIITAIMVGLSKEVMEKGYNMILYFFMSAISGLFFSIISYYILNKRKNKKINKKGLFKIGLINGILNLLSGVTMTLALGGNMAIAYTINSFSILIPIILSVIFYKEEMTYRKAFVIFLSIISMLLFI